MNIDEFIDKLAKMRDRKKWELHKDDGCIRSSYECPISSLKDRSAIEFMEVATEIGLDHSDAGEIASAADNHCLTFRDRANLREKLLVAIGLK